MRKNTEEIRREFYELSEKNKGQFVLIIGLTLVISVFTFFALLAITEFTMQSFLMAEVSNDGTPRTALISDEPDHDFYTEREKWQKDMDNIMNNPKSSRKVFATNYVTNWVIDLSVGTPSEIRFWVNPLFSLIIPAMLISAIIAVLISSLMPLNIGFMRRLIERETVYYIDKICYKVHTYYSPEKNHEIEKQLINADIHDLHTFAKDWGIPIDELKIIRHALIWRMSSVLYRFIHPLKGMNIYLRLYFTEKYGNAILGLVYMGAAILIIVIGLRGLKFIPATHPSPIIFSLAVEFTLLFTYAFTLIFAKPEQIDETYESDDRATQQSLLSNIDNSRDIENLLRAFIKSNK
ncbi:MAG: hypothetical protein B7C24_15070 [Bacteroidetes bacterium 4572_77]|nr:MAG: hypothetical protein B7C24_15070 [Bacteroidetes bacterium 4572_77]